MSHTPDPKQQNDALSLYIQALERPTEARRSFLDDVCGGDEVLRAEVEAYLQQDGEDDAFLEAPVVQLQIPTGEEHVAVPNQIGAYRVVRVLGRGGMGQVYLAEREEPFKQEVAIKVIRRGMDSEDILRRFRTERQILAALNHPNIARVLDGGMTAGGRPYLVMEYVDGEPLLAYCDAHQLSITERLPLFQTVCHAVHHAHQNLIVHRDLKPSNILVTADGTAKLLDFGIAKLLDAEHAAHSVAQTQTGVRVLTPAYASPEQIRGQVVTTVSDVYSLGILLYELLVGQRPYTIDTQSLAEAERIICKEIPRSPSTLVRRAAEIPQADGTAVTISPEAIGAARGLSPERLHRELRGGLDAIVLMALRKEPVRRYGSVELLANDIERFLAGKTVVARPDTWTYRLQRFVRRNRTGVVAGVLVVLALITGLVVSLWQAYQADQERQVAEAMTAFMEDLFSASDPFVSDPERIDTLRVRDFLDRSLARVETELADQPALRTRMLHSLGMVYNGLGDYETSSTLLGRSLASYRILYGEDHPRIRDALAGYCQTLVDVAAYERAEPICLEGVAKARTLNTKAHSRHSLSTLYLRLGRLDQSVAEARKSIAHIRAGVNDPSFEEREIFLAFSLNLLAIGLQGRNHPGDLEEAEQVIDEAVGIWEELLGLEHTSVAEGYNTWGIIFSRLGRFDDAIARHERALAIRQERLPNPHPHVGASFTNLGVVHERKENYERSAEHYLAALDIFRQTLGEEDAYYYGYTLYSLARVRYATERLDEARTLAEQALHLQEDKLGFAHPEALETRHLLAQISFAEGAVAEAFSHIDIAFQRHIDEYGKAHRQTALYQRKVGKLLTTQAHYQEAEPLLEASYVFFKASDDSSAFSDSRQALRQLYEAWQKPEWAAQY